MRKKFVSFVAVACMAGAVAAGPAQASSTAPALNIPDLSSLSSLCGSVKQPSLQAACNQGAATVQACSTQTTTNGLVSCLSNAARQFNISRVRLPAELSSLLAGFTGSAGGIKLPNLGGIKLPNLGSLSGIKLPGGLDLSKLLAGFRG